MLNRFWIGCGVGLIVGAAGSFLYLRKVFTDRYAEEVSKELEESKRVYRSLAAKQGLDIAEKDENGEEKEVEEMINIPDHQPDPIEEDFEDEDEDDYDDDELYPRDDIITVPYEIEPNVYLSDQRYEKETLFWFEDDEILVTEDDEVRDTFLTIGGDFEDWFGHYIPETTYIRNEVLGYDYEVSRKRTAYYGYDGFNRF